MIRPVRTNQSSVERLGYSESAPRQQARYACPKRHEFEVPFSADVEAPRSWECRLHGAEATLVGNAPLPTYAKPSRTHWDMLLERRSISELEEMLTERLNLLRKQREHIQGEK